MLKQIVLTGAAVAAIGTASTTATAQTVIAPPAYAVHGPYGVPGTVVVPPQPFGGEGQFFAQRMRGWMDQIEARTFHGVRAGALAPAALFQVRAARQAIEQRLAMGFLGPRERLEIRAMVADLANGGTFLAPPAQYPRYGGQGGYGMGYGPGHGMGYGAGYAPGYGPGAGMGYGRRGW